MPVHEVRQASGTTVEEISNSIDRPGNYSFSGWITNKGEKMYLAMEAVRTRNGTILAAVGVDDAIRMASPCQSDQIIGWQVGFNEGDSGGTVHFRTQDRDAIRGMLKSAAGVLESEGVGPLENFLYTHTELSPQWGGY